MKIYNTRTKKKEIIVAEKGKQINMFVCGPTVYDFSHLGHARTYLVFDAFAKYLKQSGFSVFYLQNITDIDDKIIARAKEKGISAAKLALGFEKEYLKDMKAIKISGVDKYAKATDHIKEIISQIKRLLDKGYAYKTEDGVYYDIVKFKNYGRLSNRTALRTQDAISRIDDTKTKKNKGDFCLWKLSKPEEPEWESPFGKGRPGWHIEDTAIAEKYFGYQYDIHGGARDLIFPHHEAEIAQMEAISGKRPMAKYWLHTGFLTIEGRKMSKSFGNFITIRDFLQKYSPEVLRFLVLKALWRSPIDYSEKSAEEAKAGLDKIREFLGKLAEIKIRKIGGDEIGKKILEKNKSDFYRFLDDDFNTPKAISALFKLIKEINKLIDKNSICKERSFEIISFFQEADKILGILGKEKKSPPPPTIKKLLAQREKFRIKKDWQSADDIRKKIEELGWKIEDTDKGALLTGK